MGLPSKGWSLCVSISATPPTSTRQGGEWSWNIRCIWNNAIIIIISTNNIPVCFIFTHNCDMLLIMMLLWCFFDAFLVNTHGLTMHTPMHTHSTKLFIRFPETLFKTEDLYQQKKHDLGKWTLTFYVYWSQFFFFFTLITKQYFTYSPPTHTATPTHPHNTHTHTQPLSSLPSGRCTSTVRSTNSCDGPPRCLQPTGRDYRSSATWPSTRRPCLWFESSS